MTLKCEFMGQCQGQTHKYIYMYIKHVRCCYIIYRCYLKIINWFSSGILHKALLSTNVFLKMNSKHLWIETNLASILKHWNCRYVKWNLDLVELLMAASEWEISEVRKTREKKLGKRQAAERKDGLKKCKGCSDSNVQLMKLITSLPPLPWTGRERVGREGKGGERRGREGCPWGLTWSEGLPAVWQGTPARLFGLPRKRRVLGRSRARVSPASMTPGRHTPDSGPIPLPALGGVRGRSITGSPL